MQGGKKQPGDNRRAHAVQKITVFVQKKTVFVQQFTPQGFRRCTLGTRPYQTVAPEHPRPPPADTLEVLRRRCLRTPVLWLRGKDGPHRLEKVQKPQGTSIAKRSLKKRTEIRVHINLEVRELLCTLINGVRLHFSKTGPLTGRRHPKRR